MEKQLERLMNDLSLSEAEEFVDSFEAFGTAEVSHDIQSRILSSVRRKAGSDMKEKTTVKKTRKHSKRFVGFAIAAAVLATGAIGAGAYAFAQFNNKHNVELYMGQENTDRLENVGFALNDVRENEHVRVTLDTVLSDGQSAEIIYTFEKLDDKARKLIVERPIVQFIYTDTGEMFMPHGSSSYMYYDDTLAIYPFYDARRPESDTFTFMRLIPPASADFSRPIKMYFNTEMVMDEEYKELFDGIEFDLDLSKNVETALLTSEDGRELILSPFGVSAIDPPYTDDKYFCENIFFLKADGTRVSPDDMSFYHDWLNCSYELVGDGTLIAALNDGSAEVSFAILLPTFYDLNDYIGIEIEGVQYLKQ